MRLELDLQCASEAPDLPDPAQLQHWLSIALDGRRAQAEVTVRLVDEAESQALNSQYRGIDRPTNVLSFPYQAPAVVPSDLLGDLVICAPLIAAEASAQGKQRDAHWAHIVVHGALHLLGHDHLEDQQAQQMESIEREILSRLGFSDPYEEDAER